MPSRLAQQFTANCLLTQSCHHYPLPLPTDPSAPPPHPTPRSWAITCDDPLFHGTGNKDSGDDYAAAPDLDHHNPELRDSLVDWLNWLHGAIGFEGWRFDFVRGYAPEYCREYMERTLGAEGVFYVGENFVDLRWQGSDLERNQDAGICCLGGVLKAVCQRLMGLHRWHLGPASVSLLWLAK